MGKSATKMDELSSDEAVNYYAQNFLKYSNYCEETKRVLSASFKQKNIAYHTIEARAKEVESFKRKAERLDEGGERKYKNAIVEITDLSGVRIITYTLKDVDVVCEFINSNFDVFERKDLGEERLIGGNFGYKSIHFLVYFKSDRTNLPDFDAYKNMICEIQVRTVLQHAWAEIEHDIQYKSGSALPRSLQRKFISLAGLLEIADREFQSIQDEDKLLREAIIDSLQQDITRGIINSNNTLNNEESTDRSVRQLIKLGKFEDAISLYDEKISESPSMHTLYLGRAKAKFLGGDRDAAMRDIEEALRLKSNDAMALKLQEQILEGKIRSSTPINEESNIFVKKGHEFLEQGDGVSAFEMYSEALDKGASRPFSIINRAMSCIVGEDYEGAKILLSGLEIRPGTPMGVNIHALYCIAYSLGNNDSFDDEFRDLQRSMEQVESYAFELSPLARLDVGLKNNLRLTNQINEKVDKVLDFLKAGKT